MEIRTGKYKMRDGKEANITSVNPDANLAFTGHYEGDNGEQYWYKDGKYCSAIECHLDLIELLAEPTPETGWSPSSTKIKDYDPDAVPAEKQEPARENEPGLPREMIALDILIAMIRNRAAERDMEQMIDTAFDFADHFIERRDRDV